MTIFSDGCMSLPERFRKRFSRCWGTLVCQEAEGVLRPAVSIPQNFELAQGRFKSQRHPLDKTLSR